MSVEAVEKAALELKPMNADAGIKVQEGSRSRRIQTVDIDLESLNLGVLDFATIRYVIKYFSLYSVYVQCESFAILTFYYYSQLGRVGLRDDQSVFCAAEERVCERHSRIEGGAPGVFARPR